MVAIGYPQDWHLIVEVFHKYDPTFYHRESYDLGEVRGELRAFTERVCAMTVKRVVPEGTDAGRAQPAADPVLARKYPRLTAHLVELLYDDGEPRQPATLLVFTGEGEWKLCLHDRDAGAHLWASGPSLEKAMATLEERLCEDNPGWRVKREDGKTGKRK